MDGFFQPPYFRLLAFGGIFIGTLGHAYAGVLDSNLTGEGRMACIVYTDSSGVGDFKFPAFTYQDHCPGEEPAVAACSDGRDNVDLRTSHAERSEHDDRRRRILPIRWGLCKRCNILLGWGIDELVLLREDWI